MNRLIFSDMADGIPAISAILSCSVYPAILFNEVIFVYRGDQVMKVIAFNGSARKQGNTAILINHVFSELEKEG